MAGVGPGLLLTAMFIAWTMFQYRRDRLRATAAAAGRRAGAARARALHVGAAARDAAALRCRSSLLIALIMVALYGGWATPSEVAGIGAAGVAADGRADLPLLPLGRPAR